MKRKEGPGWDTGSFESRMEGPGGVLRAVGRERRKWDEILIDVGIEGAILNGDRIIYL